MEQTKSDRYITIDTNLINKKEVFKMLALAHSSGLPVLLIGNPGTGKTRIALDYAKAWIMQNIDKSNKQEMTQASNDYMDKVYILETDEGTKASEIKGTPDIENMFINNKYSLNTPIADAEIIIVNEIDKASSAIRNSLLGVMNEKFIFNGKEKIPCKWKLFIGACNEIPKEEEGSPFWDRFILKKVVNRISSSDVLKYYEGGEKSYKECFDINIPTKEEIDDIEVNSKKLNKFLTVSYNKCSDRTLTFIPKLTKIISKVWEENIDKSLIRLASIIVGSAAASELHNSLISTEVKSILNKIEVLYTVTDPVGIEAHMNEIEALIKGYTASKKIDSDDLIIIEDAITEVMNKHPSKAQNDDDTPF